MKNILATLLLASASCFTFAAGTSNGPVTVLLVNSSNVLFFTAGTKVGSPSCGPNNQWVIDLSSPEGKSSYALLLSAQALGQTVYVVGTGVCLIWGDREDALYMYTAQ